MPGARQARKSALPALLLGAAAAVLFSSSTSFVNTRAVPTLRPKVASHAFVDEFQDWRKSLTADEQAMLGRQSKYMFN
eukprot:CAMPEP_0178416938 /NCGR_PEP_ID=MMETSP0689_2-20121128/24320_1 /TAXON_ID=160604 /ORGANISM="Amphidinium massartii, Strain CS-259" /LENGTH=77 /DNA_ID=CAMNT_0020038295 /DNA_START=39 /DNA_END=269 /DNA_ORIENTATION=-